MIDQGIRKSDQFLRSNEQVEMAAIVMTGAYLETLHLTMTTVDIIPTEETEIIIKKLGEVAMPLTEMLHSFQDSPKFAGIVMQVEPLMEIMTHVNDMERLDEGITQQIIDISEMMQANMKSNM